MSDAELGRPWRRHELGLNHRTILDDRRQRARVRLFGVSCWLTLRGNERKVVKFYDRLWRRRHSAKPIWLMLTTLFFWGQTFLLASIAWKRWNAGLMTRDWTLALWSIAGIVGIVSLAWPWLVMRSLRRLEAKRKRLPRRCPSCLYALVDLPVEADGCTLCPECGGAWKFEEKIVTRRSRSTPATHATDRTPPRA